MRQEATVLPGRFQLIPLSSVFAQRQENSNQFEFTYHTSNFPTSFQYIEKADGLK